MMHSNEFLCCTTVSYLIHSVWFIFSLFKMQTCVVQEMKFSFFKFKENKSVNCRWWWFSSRINIIWFIKKIKHHTMSEFHSLSRDLFLRELMSLTASYDINHLSLLIFIQQSIDIVIKILSFSSCMLLLHTIFQKSFHLNFLWMRRRSMIERLLIIVQRNDSRNIIVNWIKSQRLLHFLSHSSRTRLLVTTCIKFLQ